MCSVSLSLGDEVLALKETLEGNKHSVLLASYIDACLSSAGIKANQLDAVSVSSGPGSYTGLRVGASTAKGICFTTGIPLIAVDSLEALALRAADIHQADIIAPMIDARRMEVYTAYFDARGKRITENTPQILEKDIFNRFLSDNQAIVLCGNGTSKAKQLFEHERIICDEKIIHSSLHLLKPALIAFENQEFADLHQFAPGYLKAPNITIPKKSMI